MEVFAKTDCRTSLGPKEDDGDEISGNLLYPSSSVCKIVAFLPSVGVLNEFLGLREETQIMFHRSGQIVTFIR